MFEPPEEEPSQHAILAQLDKAQAAAAQQPGGNEPPIKPPVGVAAASDDDSQFNPMGGDKFQTSLKLSIEQEAKLVDRIFKRMDECNSESGLEAGGVCRDGSWMHRREIYQKQYDNEWAWREAKGGIFQFSNFSPNIAKTNVRRLGAKITDDLLGTDPFFGTMPETRGDAETSKQIEWFVQEKIGQSNMKPSLGEAELRALIINESVVKLSYLTDITYFRGPLKVAVGPFQYTANGETITTAEGEPVMTPKGEYILENDDFPAHPDVENLFYLQKEPSVESAFAPEFMELPDLQQKLKHSEGLDVRVLEFKDFFCPLNVNSIHEADICGCFRDETFAEIQQRYGNFESSEQYFNSFQSAQKSPMLDKGEQESTSELLHFVNIAEVFIRVDADEDGLQEELWCVVDRVNRKIIWADYLGVHMARRPFEVIPGIEKVPNRWYGVGVFELLSHKQEFIDLQFNRVSNRNSQSAVIRFLYANAITEIKDGQRMEVGTGQFYTVNSPEYGPDRPPVFQINLADQDPMGIQLMEFMLQAAQTEMGIAGPDDGGMSGLDSTKLATGLRALERIGNTLVKYTIASHATAIVQILRQGIDMILEKMDESELLYYPQAQKLITLNRDEIRAIPRNIKLLLTRTRSSETLANGQEIDRVVQQYYGYNPFMQWKLRPNSIAQLRALEVQDADNLLEEVTEQQARAWQAAQNQPQAPEPPSKSVSTKLEDFVPSERSQIVESMGITPGSPEEVAAVEAQKQIQKAAENAAKMKSNPPGKGKAPNAGK